MAILCNDGNAMLYCCVYSSVLFRTINTVSSEYLLLLSVICYLLLSMTDTLYSSVLFSGSAFRFMMLYTDSVFFLSAIRNGLKMLYI